MNKAERKTHRLDRIALHLGRITITQPSLDNYLRSLDAARRINVRNLNARFLRGSITKEQIPGLITFLRTYDPIPTWEELDQRALEEK